MKILVCISHVPDTTSKISFTDNNTRFDKTGVQYIIGPYDDYALARAVEIKEATGGTVTVLNVGLFRCLWSGCERWIYNICDTVVETL